MGKTFKLISDLALMPEDPEYYTECQVCRKENIPVYPCQGCIIDDNGEANEDEDVYVACEQCLKAGKIEHIDEYYLNNYIKKYVKDYDVEKALLRTTPRCPTFVQDHDWPICCGLLTEYIGEPNKELAKELDQFGKYWYFGPSNFDSKVVELIPSEELAVLGGVSAFNCFECSQKYWIFQFT